MVRRVSENRMSPKEFRELGFLQEVNRCFLHPLGLALEIVRDTDTGEESFGAVWDYRDDPEGMIFGDELDAEKAASIHKLQVEKAIARHKKFGWTLQPLEDEKE